MTPWHGMLCTMSELQLPWIGRYPLWCFNYGMCSNYSWTKLSRLKNFIKKLWFLFLRMHVFANFILHIHYICNIIYAFSSPHLLSLELPSSSVVRFTPIVRFILVLTISATEETTVSNSGRSCCLTINRHHWMLHSRTTEWSTDKQRSSYLIPWATDAAKGTMGHVWKFSSRIIWAYTVQNVIPDCLSQFCVYSLIHARVARVHKCWQCYAL